MRLCPADAGFQTHVGFDPTRTTVIEPVTSGLEGSLHTPGGDLGVVSNVQRAAVIELTKASSQSVQSRRKSRKSGHESPSILLPGTVPATANRRS
ncbi:MAG: hypothetical protein QOJ42_684 [Acidobacteriaceae bacterium]|nr:hypothetical protein [Acidobacteriaceae bacterium]MDX6461385.1 hypothetical protein [Acidobacteriaceae bacterium]